MKIPISCLLAGVVAASPVLAAGHLHDDVEVRNLSTRGVVGAGEETMITGISVEGPKTDYVSVLFRGIGPSLTEFGMMNSAGNPSINLYKGAT